MAIMHCKCVMVGFIRWCIDERPEASFLQLIFLLLINIPTTLLSTLTDGKTYP